VNAATHKRAVEIHQHRKLIDHEAGHAAAALLLGLDVESITAPYWTVEDALSGDPDDPAGQVLIRPVDPASDPAGARALALTTLAGPLADDRANWPPNWPLSLAPMTPDEAQLGELVKALELDRAGYAQLVQDAFELTLQRDFERLHVGLSCLLERHGTLDAVTARRIKAIAEGTEMEHLTFKAVTTTTEQGEFEAVISTATVDRERDIVDPAGMVRALHKWTRTGKLIPLAWHHSTAAEDQIGHVDPASAREVDGEVVVKGWVDQSTDRGAEAWRLVKSGTLGFSFGYLILTATKRAGGGRHITELEVFEITATTVPANADTRVLAYKAIDPELDHVRVEWRDDMLRRLGAGPTVTSRDALREKSARLAREHAPVQIATFDC
jgi:HK97 family phage prohead protease